MNDDTHKIALHISHKQRINAISIDDVASTAVAAVVINWFRIKLVIGK